MVEKCNVVSHYNKMLSTAALSYSVLTFKLLCRL